MASSGKPPARHASTQQQDRSCVHRPGADPGHQRSHAAEEYTRDAGAEPFMACMVFVVGQLPAGAGVRGGEGSFKEGGTGGHRRSFNPRAEDQTDRVTGDGQHEILSMALFDLATQGGRGG